MRTLLVCLAACSLVDASEIRAGLEPQSVRKTAQDFVLLGCVRQVGLAVQLQGQAPWTFWATKCGGCIKEIPSFIEVHHTYASRGLAVVGISMDILYEDLKGPGRPGASLILSPKRTRLITPS